MACKTSVAYAAFYDLYISTRLLHARSPSRLACLLLGPSCQRSLIILHPLPPSTRSLERRRHVETACLPCIKQMLPVRLRVAGGRRIDEGLLQLHQGRFERLWPHPASRRQLGLWGAMKHLLCPAQRLQVDLCHHADRAQAVHVQEVVAHVELVAVQRDSELGDERRRGCAQQGHRHGGQEDLLPAQWERGAQACS